jgi:hypothetical protein
MTMTCQHTVEVVPMTHWLRLIRAEYRDMPGLSLTRPQMQRLWGFSPDMCNELVDALIGANILRVTDAGNYVIADSGR